MRRSGHDLAKRALPPATRSIHICCANSQSERVNHFWAADITYIPVGRGFLYLVAIIDWASRAILAWRVSKRDGCLVLRGGATPWPSMASRRSSIPTRLASSPAPRSPARFRPPESGSPWTDAGVGWTTSSSNVSGDRSSTRTSTLRDTRRPRGHGRNLQLDRLLQRASP
ncbi:DDE-type integrase/transposase/recombinase [Bradyrhizobium paxllaeri]|uniref:DDE-type integrase/transposase/recombinase n=1 Tax=Bradyrhizobium paxllaeri TaxID=190148 RepID=UPI003D31392B